MKIDSEFLKNPYPYYTKNRLNNTLKYFELNEDYDSPGFWGIFSYKDAFDIFKNSIGTCKDFSAIKNEKNKHLYDLNLLNRDNEDHARLRKLTLNYFSTKSVAIFNAYIEAVVDRQINFIKAKSDIDLIADFAKEIPIYIILEIVGIKTSRATEIVRWINCILIDSLTLDEPLKLKRKVAVHEFGLFVKDISSSKNNFDSNSLIYSLISAAESEKLSQDELIAYLMFLIVAGHETTTDLIGNSLYTLLNNKNLIKLIIDNSAFVDSFIEEILRFESPVQRSTFRVLNEEVCISGVKLKQGDQIRVFIGSANRDEKAFKNPDIFDINRKPNMHLAFGLGPHNCMGQFLARLEAKISILKIAQYLNYLSPINDKPLWKINNFSRGLEELKVCKTYQ